MGFDIEKPAQKQNKDIRIAVTVAAADGVAVVDGGKGRTHLHSGVQAETSGLLVASVIIRALGCLYITTRSATWLSFPFPHLL